MSFHKCAHAIGLASHTKKLMLITDAILVLQGRFPAIEKFVGGFDSNKGDGYITQYLRTHFETLSGVIATEDVKDAFDRLTANEVRLRDDPSIHDGSATDNVGNIKGFSSFKYFAHYSPEFAPSPASEYGQIFEFDTSLIPAGMAYQWWRLSVFGLDDGRNILEAKKRGWKVVPIDRHPETEEIRDRSEKGRIVVHGMLLMEISREQWSERSLNGFQAALDQIEKLHASFDGDGRQVVDPKPQIEVPHDGST